jgi:hypothetical protein
MNLSKLIFLSVFVVMALPLMAVAQSSNPTTAGATPLSANFDVWPSHLPLDNGFGNFDVAAIGVNPETSREQFVFYGIANDAQCGPKMAIVSQAGVDVTVRDALVDDNGVEFLGAAAVANFGGIGGFGWRASVDGDPSTGQYICSQIFFNNDLDIAFPNPVQAFIYAQSSIGPNHVNDHYLSQRFNRNATKVSNITNGRNIPSAASHTQDPWFPVDGHESRASGNAILSNGNSLHYISDRSRSGGTETDKGVVEYFSENGIVPGLNNGTSHRCQVHTITSPDASTFVVSTTPTFVNPANKSTFDNANPQQAAAGQGWFAMRADSAGGALAFFRNDGSRITQIYGYQAIYENTVGLLPNEDDIIANNGGNAISASNNTLFVVCRYQLHADGINHPAVLRFQLDAGLTTVTPLPIIIVDNDFTVPSALTVHENTIDIQAIASGAFTVAYRRDPNEAPGGGAVVARVYDTDGTPATGSFFVSSLADPTTDISTGQLGYDDGTIKVGMNNNVVCVGWFTENGVDTVDAPDCSGNPKSQNPEAPYTISTAARIFSIPSLTPSEVGNWDLY